MTTGDSIVSEGLLPELPALLVITGRPGSGKTTFAREFGKQCYLPIISRDELKEGYLNTFQKSHSELPDDTNKVVSAIFFNAIRYLLGSQVSIIAEAAFQHQVWAPQLNAIKEKAKIFLLICTVEDEIAVGRFIKRALANPMREYFHGDQGVDVAKNDFGLIVDPYDEPRLDLPTFHIDTTNGYNPSINELRTTIWGMYP